MLLSNTEERFHVILLFPSVFSTKQFDGDRMFVRWTSPEQSNWHALRNHLHLSRSLTGRQRRRQVWLLPWSKPTPAAQETKAGPLTASHSGLPRDPRCIDPNVVATQRYFSRPRHKTAHWQFFGGPLTSSMLTSTSPNPSGPRDLVATGVRLRILLLQWRDLIVHFNGRVISRWALQFRSNFFLRRRRRMAEAVVRVTLAGSMSTSSSAGSSSNVTRHLSVRALVWTTISSDSHFICCITALLPGLSVSHCPQAVSLLKLQSGSQHPRSPPPSLHLPILLRIIVDTHEFFKFLP